MVITTSREETRRVFNKYYQAETESWAAEHISSPLPFCTEMLFYSFGTSVPFSFPVNWAVEYFPSS